MTADPLSSPLLATLPPPRKLTPDDLTACLALGEDRGWSREEHKWRLLLTAGQGYGIDAPDRPGELIAAYVLTTYADAYACVSMVLVARRHARRGIGRHLMRHALDSSGTAALFLQATENGRPLYERMGFRPVGTTTMLTGPFSPPPYEATGAAARTSVRPASATDLRAVLALDAEVFGTDRTELLTRLPAFSDRFVVAEDPAGALTGFAARWPNGPTDVFGPVVAEDLATAQALVTELAVDARDRVRFDVDARHPEWERWLRAGGLSGDFRCTLMVHTAADIPGDISRRFAPYSVALG
ncbi:GNAT family N-acetyltransferase [Streptomyces sp. Z26]|uniref:GNAT family N-acetyltransferase n=1 Tax=Streptomyces sp. Z26 TaxID=2500177 RepID=UPI000EF15701|nr:GNAT family N-acetyltransferase [Streptomyces sp. Z26]RLL67869.1 N-acetyltransferase [Streptomyces sp. Z26]